MYAGYYTYHPPTSYPTYEEWHQGTPPDWNPSEHPPNHPPPPQYPNDPPQGPFYNPYPGSAGPPPFPNRPDHTSWNAACYNCGMRGHSFKRCPHPPDDAQIKRGQTSRDMFFRDKTKWYEMQRARAASLARRGIRSAVLPYSSRYGEFIPTERSQSSTHCYTEGSITKAKPTKTSRSLRDIALEHPLPPKPVPASKPIEDSLSNAIDQMKIDEEEGEIQEEVQAPVPAKEEKPRFSFSLFSMFG